MIGPTADGGYYLLALRANRIDPALFAGVAWSTGRVLEQTLERCRKLGLRRAMLDTGRDIDRPARPRVADREPAGGPRRVAARGGLAATS